jgi:hypothetical protein
MALPLCFVAMPFTAQHHFVYLFLKNHIEATYLFSCERADDRILEMAIWEKMRDMIVSAEVVVADVTGGNANVLYELGLAHASKRRTVLITSDPIERVPTDIRLFDIVQYQFGQHSHFLGRFDIAMRTALGITYDLEFEEAVVYFREFRSTCPEARSGSKEIFVSRYQKLRSTKNQISPQEKLNCLVENNDSSEIMRSILEFEPAAPTPGLRAES